MAPRAPQVRGMLHCYKHSSNRAHGSTHLYPTSTFLKVKLLDTCTPIRCLFCHILLNCLLENLFDFIILYFPTVLSLFLIFK